MEEKWNPHPNRKNNFINKDDSLLYERIRGWYNRLPGQKMTELQESAISMDC